MAVRDELAGGPGKKHHVTAEVRSALGLNLPVAMTTEVEKIPVDRTKTCPFLLRTFVRSGGFHPETTFENGRGPTLDEHAVHVWSDSTLIDVVRALRAQTPSPSLPAGAFRNPGTKYAFRTVFYDRGAVTSRDLGQVGPRDLNDVSALHPPPTGQIPTPPTEPTDLPPDSVMDADDDSPRKDRDDEDVSPVGVNTSGGGRAKLGSRTLDELRVQPGDWLSVSITLPAGAKPVIGQAGIAIRGAEREREGEPGGHWRGGGGGGGRGRPAGLVRGGGHLAFGRDRPPPGRDVSPPRNRDGPDRRGGGYGRRPSPDMTRGGTSYRDASRSRSRERRSRSPVGRRRGGRYERD